MPPTQARISLSHPSERVPRPLVTAERACVSPDTTAQGRTACLSNSSFNASISIISNVARLYDGLNETRRSDLCLCLGYPAHSGTLELCASRPLRKREPCLSPAASFPTLDGADFFLCDNPPPQMPSCPRLGQPARKCFQAGLYHTSAQPGERATPSAGINASSCAISGFENSLSVKKLQL